MASIADVFFQALLEDKQLQIDAVTAGDKAGQTLGGRMSKGISTSLRAGLAVVGGLTGFAAKGLTELDTITRRFAADTGASAEEAKAAGDAILSMSRRNLQPLSEIGDALTKVHTDMGLTGKQAEDTTEAFLKFSEVTKRDASEEVAAFDDILDAWGKTAEDSVGIMDQLVKSHQEYGGAIAEDEAALKSMAPQLKALNLGFDDAIALLNLFKTAGIDASQAPRALASALTKLNGESFPDFVKELSSIQDPARRAQRAIEVLGTRFGPQFANAIKPGVGALSDFGVSATDAAGATSRAADVIEDSITNKIKLAIKNLGGAVLQAAQDFSPLLLALTSLGSLAGAVGLDRFAGKIVSAMADVGKQAGEAFIDASQTAVGTLGTVFGNIIARVIDPTESAFGNPLRAAGAKAGAFFGRVFATAAAIADRLIEFLLGLPGVRGVVTAVESSATQLGTRWGTRFGVAAAVGIGLLVPEILDAITPKDAQDAAAQFGTDYADTFAGATIDELQKRRAELAAAYLKATTLPSGFDPLRPFKDLFGEPNDASAQIKDLLDKVDAAIAAWQQSHGPVEVTVQPTLGPPIPPNYVQQQARLLREQFLTAGQLAATAFLSAWDNLPIAQKLIGMGHDLRIAAANLTLSVAAGLRSGRSNITAALDQLREDMKNRLSPRKEVALRIGQLFSRTLVRGLRSADPIVRKQAEGTRALIEDQLIETIKAGGRAGEKIQEELERKLHSKDPRVRAQAKRTKELIDAALKNPTAGKSPGDKIGDDLAADLASKGSIVGRVAYQMGVLIARNLRAGVHGSGQVAAPSGGGGGAPKQGGPQEFAEGTNYVPSDQYALLHQGEMVIPAKQAAMIRSGDWNSTVGPITVTVDARGATNPAAVGRSVRQGIADAMADTLRQQTARLPVGTRA